MGQPAKIHAQARPRREPMSTRVRPPALEERIKLARGELACQEKLNLFVSSLIRHSIMAGYGRPDELLETLPPPSPYDLHVATAHQSTNPHSVPLLSTLAIYSSFRNPQSTPLRFPAPLPLFIRAQNDRLPPSDLIPCAIASSRPVW